MHIRDVFTKQCTLTTIGVLLSISGVVFAMFWTNIFEYMMAKEMAMRPDSRSYDVWKTPPLPMSIDIYFYNWTNARTFKNFSTKPILKELGPYRFIEKTDKVDIRWHPHNFTVSFKKKSSFYFDTEGSNGRLEDKITTLNIVALSAAAKALHWDYVKQKSVAIGLSLYEQEVSITKTASELLFEGYQDDMIDMAREYPIFGEDVTVPFDRFGWFYTRNGSADLMGHFNIFTGENDINKLGQMHTWNYITSTNFFETYCGMVNGSAGEFYPPKQKINDSISFFTPDLCRSISLDYAEIVNIEGIDGFKYSGGPRTVDNGTIYPENKCFCSGDCVPSGVLNVSSCRFGTPVFMSFPHYFNADPYFLNLVEGLHPDKDKHEFYMILEPSTGIALEVAARFQINMLVRPSENITLYKNVPYIFLPVLWFEQRVRINSEIASELKIVLSIPTIGQISAGVVIALGLIMIFWFPVDRLFRNGRLSQKKLRFKNQRQSSSHSEKNIGDNNSERYIGREILPEGSPLIKTNSKLDKVAVISCNSKEALQNLEGKQHLERAESSNNKILDDKECI